MKPADQRDGCAINPAALAAAIVVSALLWIAAGVFVAGCLS